MTLPKIVGAPGDRPLPTRVLVTTLLVLGPGAAWACRPDFHLHESPVRVEGEAGAVAWLYDAWSETSIGPAEDLGSGFVRQELLDGDWCYGEASTLIHDCTTGEAVVFGGEFDRAIPQTYEPATALSELIAERAGRGQPLSTAEIRDEAIKRDLGFVVLMRTTSSIAVGDYEFQLGQACRTHYPNLQGANP